MKLFEPLLPFFTPRHTNNHKAKAQIFISAVARFDPQVLGYASNINVGDLLADMFANNYWAHNSPQGRNPWSFIIAAG